MEILSSEVVLYLYKQTIRFYLKYYFHAWAGAPIFHFEILNFWYCFFWTLGSSTCLVYYRGITLDEVISLIVPLSNSHESFTHYSNRLHDFSVTILTCYKRAISVISFPIQLHPEIHSVNAFHKFWPNRIYV